ncbi:VOC family protein [Neobacillus bataviensis]|uniref:VOC family protein n=1 Tax=Neobacillus bataviensis TaxID=220685 RepID=UPI001CBE89C9|nr:VOC family protein [Neobacillus bataviensis]
MRNAKLYETHVYCKNLEKSIEFYQSLDLDLAYVLNERRVAFFWLGEPGTKEQMLGVWEVPEDQFFKKHFAFALSVEQLQELPQYLESKGIELRPAFGFDASEPVVHAWMPAACYYFEDPDGNSLEYLAVLEGDPQPELGVIQLSQWKQHQNV